MGSRIELLPRWYSSLGEINVILGILEDVLPDIPPLHGRGQPPKHPLKSYLTLIILKELKRSSLRSAETDWSVLVCGERVDHSVIQYWEDHLPKEVVEAAVRSAGAELEKLLGYDFSMVDATSFADWHQQTVGFHLLNRVRNGAVYPVNVCGDTLDPVPNTQAALLPGEGFLMADRWYDVNRVFRVVERAGYCPLIKPKRNAGRGRWRRRGRRVYNLHWRAYRQRGRGESPFGSLTNAFGDRLRSRKGSTTYTRSLARVLVYQTKLLVRARAASGSSWENS